MAEDGHDVSVRRSCAKGRRRSCAAPSLQKVTRAALRNGSPQAASNPPETAAARRFNDEHITRRHLDTGDMAQRDDLAVRPFDAIAALSSRSAACRAEWRVDAVVRQDRGCHRREKAD